jgi:hypothetical protein
MKPQMIAHYEVDVTAHDPEQSPFARTSCLPHDDCLSALHACELTAHEYVCQI